MLDGNVTSDWLAALTAADGDGATLAWPCAKALVEIISIIMLVTTFLIYHPNVNIQSKSHSADNSQPCLSAAIFLLSLQTRAN